MTPEQFLKQLNPNSRVFDLSIDYRYTEYQLLLFAKLYHESELKTFQNSSRCYECNSLNVEKDLILNELYCYNCEKIVNTKI